MDLPPRPDESDCCNSGCNPCILDVYEDLLLKYKRGSLKKSIENLDNCIEITAYSVFRTTEITQHTHDTFLMTFEYVKPHRSEAKNGPALRYRPGQYFLIKGNAPWDKNEEFTRPYTPIPYYNGTEKGTIVETNLAFTVAVKLYEGGEMSQYIKRLKVGSETLWRGPYGEFEIDYSYRNILFIAQGVGIAPIFAILKTMLENDECETFLTLYFCCRSINDIPLRDKVYEPSAYWNFKYEVFLSNGKGMESKYNELLYGKRLRKDEIAKYLEDKQDVKSQVIICGGRMFEEAMEGYVRSCRVDEKDIVLF